MAEVKGGMRQDYFRSNSNFTEFFRQQETALGGAFRIFGKFQAFLFLGTTQHKEQDTEKSERTNFGSLN